MDNFVQPGSRMNYTAGGTITKGDIIVLKHQLGIALDDAVSGDVIAVGLEGVFNNVPKVSAAVFVVGEKLLFDSSASKFDDSAATAAAGDILGAAYAWEAGENAETTCTIKLTNGNNTLTA